MSRKHKKLPKIKLNPTQQVGLATLLFLFAVLLTRGSSVSTFEANIFNAINDLPSWLYLPFYYITQFGSVYILGILLVVYLVKQHHHIVIRLLMTGSLAYLLAGLAKSLWGRARPHELLPDILTLDYFQGAGFPSGHVALAAAVAFTMGHYLGKRYFWLIAAWVVGVSLSRMYLGVHLPLDIVGGIAIGWFSYAIFRHVRLYDIPRRTKKVQNKS
jgi:glycosyltransferase 2 family protein